MIQIIVQDTPDATKKMAEQSVVVDYAKAQAGIDILLLGQPFGLKIRCDKDRIVADYRA